ncbi:tetratricopeptide repeat protein [Paludisphaera mucosa]|uniref:Tetratricopeptide repeat protein n=1 Tax=Paludisphaera mucosa TaxID=3030827 RepID=A0ABT6FCH3_9BACT|nr:tetratricopeptide repeat protein [Paludisphaera mucosa]MDG3005256.1 tetratricopeptide repeat protein [Paludisphaera mucosa]
MRRKGLIAFVGVLIWMLPALPGCSWAGARRGSKDSLSPEKAAQAKAVSERAQAAVDAGDLTTAEAELAQLVAISPGSPEGYQRLGAVLQLRGRPAEAETCFRKALDLDPDFVGALIGLSRIEAARGQLDSALKRLETAIEIEPHDAAGHLTLAQVLEALGRTDDGLAAYYRALKADPFLIEANRRIAAIQLSRNEADQALVRLDQTIETNPGDAESVFLRGRAHLALHHVPQAVDDLRTASQHLPDRPDVHLALAHALDAARRPADALQAAENALRLAPGDVEALNLSERLRR